jgi:hypothetical protein
VIKKNSTIIDLNLRVKETKNLKIQKLLKMKIKGILLHHATLD